MIDSNKTKILVIDDEKAICEILSESLKDDGYYVDTAHDGLHGLKAISEFKPDIVLLDIWMPGELDGLEVLSRAKAKYPGVQFIMMSGHGTIETAVKATKLGAWDFVEKPLSMDKISILITNILSYRNERNEKIALLNKLRNSIALVGNSATMISLKQLISRVAASNSWVLITGENGSGKHLVAQNIHYLSSRAGKPLVEVNCASLSPELMESEIFGLEDLKFSAGPRRIKGKAELAQGGTLFLNEIGELSLSCQAKLLHMLNEKVIIRQGSSEKIAADVRVVASSKIDLGEKVAAGQFLEELSFRINVLPIKIPPLQERIDDIPVLISHFSEHFAREGGFDKKNFEEMAVEKLKAYTWPGNVRELRNFIERLYILVGDTEVGVPELAYAGLAVGMSAGAFDEDSFRQARADFEKEFLLHKISENNGNISKTAESIGLERSYLHRKIKSYGIDC